MSLSPPQLVPATTAKTIDARHADFERVCNIFLFDPFAHKANDFAAIQCSVFSVDMLARSNSAPPPLSQRAVGFSRSKLQAG
jgi:hypothetical protein